MIVMYVLTLSGPTLGRGHHHHHGGGGGYYYGGGGPWYSYDLAPQYVIVSSDKKAQCQYTVQTASGPKTITADCIAEPKK